MRPSVLSPSRLMQTASAVVLGCLLLGCCNAARADERQKKIKKENRRAESHEIEAMEQTWIRSLVKRDTATLEKLMADDFSAVSANGTISDKPQYLARVSHGQIAFTNIEMLDIKVKVQPSVAIVVSQVRLTGELEGRPANGVYRYLKVYGRTVGGPWQVLNMEATRVSGVNPDGADMHRGMPLTGRPGVYR